MINYIRSEDTERISLKYPKHVPQKIEIAILVIIGLGAWIAALTGIVFTIQTGAYGSLSRLYSIITITTCAVVGALAIIFALNFSCQNSSSSLPIIISDTIDSEESNSTVSDLPPNSWCALPSYYERANEIMVAPACETGDVVGEVIILEQRYLQRKDVIKFNSNGKIFNLPETGGLISFGITPPLSIGEKKDGSIINTFDTVFLYLYECVEEIKNKGLFIPKIFIPMATNAKGLIPHGILLVIEPCPTDSSQAKITIINSLGQGGAYETFENDLAALGKGLFDSPQTSIIHNLVQQQEDGWACGWHMMENIRLLEEIADIQQFILNNSLPKRSEKEIQKVYDNKYRFYARQALKRKIRSPS